MVDFINIKALLGLSNSELLEVMESTGMIPSFETLQIQAVGYIQRMTELPAGSIQFKAAVNNLISMESRRGLLGMTRRAAQQFTTLNDIGGDTKTEMIWVSEADEDSCNKCLANAAEIHTYEEWQQIGLPGAATCDGGDYCRCDLLKI